MAILKKGDLIVSGDVNEILSTEDIIEVSANDTFKLSAVITQMNGYKNFKENGKFLHLFYPAGKANLEEINRYCFDNGVVLTHLQLKKKSLESKFIELTNN